MEHVYIITLNWNGWADTKECLQSVFESTYKNFTVVLLDNGSKSDCDKIHSWALEFVDGYKAFDKDELSNEKVILSNDHDPSPASRRLVFIRNNENLGFAKANNIGIQLAKKNQVPYVLLLNNDTVIEKDAIEKLVGFLEAKPEYSAVVPQIRYFEPSDTIWCCGGEIDNYYEKYHFKNQKYHVLPSKDFSKISFATGCALLIRNNDFSFLTEKFFFGEEDYELSLRLQKENKQLACLYKAIVYHKESVSINKSSKYINKIFLHKLNRFIDIRDYAPATWLFRIVYRSVKYFFLMLLIEKTGLLKAVENAAMLFRMSVRLKEVNKHTFEYVLSLQLN